MLAKETKQYLLTDVAQNIKKWPFSSGSEEDAT
jgi:hypothetical protein